MFLFRFVWWVFAGMFRLALVLGISLYLFVNASHGVDSLATRTTGWLDELKQVDVHEICDSIEESAFQYLARRRLDRTEHSQRFIASRESNQF